jgi:hypothetical protein
MEIVVVPVVVAARWAEEQHLVASVLQIKVLTEVWVMQIISFLAVVVVLVPRETMALVGLQVLADQAFLLPLLEVLFFVPVEVEVLASGVNPLEQMVARAAEVKDLLLPTTSLTA